MSTTVRTEPAPDVNEMVVIHRVFRREFVAIPRLVRQVRGSDTDRAAIVADHLQLMLTGLHMHHTGEDELLWPLLLERAAPSAALVETMQHQHHRVDEYAAHVEVLAEAWRSEPSAVRAEQLARAIEQFATSLFEHLDLEEREILPLVTRHISVPEWHSLAQHGEGQMSKRQLPLMFGALFEQADEGERKRLVVNLPVAARVYVRTIGARQYARYITRVRAA